MKRYWWTYAGLALAYAGLGALRAGWAVLAIHVASRLAYVGYVGWALNAEERRRVFTGPRGVADGFRRFQDTASVIMTNDGVSFVLACWLTRGTVALPDPAWPAYAAGAALILLGVIIKLWAASTLGSQGYYWYDFFAHAGATEHRRDGPYRFLTNPMYTVGYLQCYGLAVMLASLPGLLVSLFDQLAILVFYWTVERPHYQRLYLKEALHR